LTAGLNLGASFSDSGEWTAHWSFAGGVNYHDDAGDVTILIGKLDQGIAFGALPDRTYGDAAFAVSATGGGSGNPVSFASMTPGTCDATGAGGSTITILTAGTCTIRASQDGSARYHAAANVDRTFTINKKSAKVTVDAKTKLHNTPDPVLTGALSEFLPGDLVTVSYSRVAGESVGTYPISAELLPVGAFNNYAVTYVNSSLTITYDWGTGFLSPVDNLPVVNGIKAGSAVPVKFSLKGDKGLGIFTAGYPKSVTVNCETGVPVDEIEETVTAGSSSLSYDPVADQYAYLWKTDRSWAGCRQLQVVLKDGLVHLASFKFHR
jgi:hypothetical protein